MVKTILSTVIFSFLTLIFTTSCSTPPKQAFNSKMANQVFVLGVPHFTALKFKNPDAVIDPVNNKLISWNPTSICVEARHPQEAQEMMSKKDFFPTYKKLYSHFQRKQYEIGHGFKKKLKLSHTAIEAKIESLISKDNLTDFERITLIKYFLANYDAINAYLQWSYLKDKKTAIGKVGKQTTELFKKYDSSSNEIYSLAVPLAKKLGHKTICSMDSQRDATQVFIKGRKKLLDELGKDPKIKNFSKSPIRKKSSEIDKEFETTQNLLPILEFYNSSPWENGSDAQWDWERESNNKLAKVHYMGWELRNKRMTSNILEAAQSIGPQKVLVIVGSSHLHPLKQELKTTDTTKLVEFNEVF